MDPAAPDSAIEAAAQAAAAAVTFAEVTPGPVVSGGPDAGHSLPEDDPVVVSTAVTGAWSGTVLLAVGDEFLERVQYATKVNGAVEALGPLAESMLDVLGPAVVFEPDDLEEVEPGDWPGQGDTVWSATLLDEGEVVAAVAFAITPSAVDPTVAAPGPAEADRAAGAPDGSEADDAPGAPAATAGPLGDAPGAGPDAPGAGPDAAEAGVGDDEGGSPAPLAGSQDAVAVSAPGTSSLSTSEPPGTPTGAHPAGRARRPGAGVVVPRRQPREVARLSAIEVELAGVLGETTVLLHELLAWLPGVIIPLHRPVGDPVDLRVGPTTLATGEVVAVDEHYGLRVVDVVRGAAQAVAEAQAAGDGTGEGSDRPNSAP
jgi:flagellar motor switch/type III secretory pathway protein FliN